MSALVPVVAGLGLTIGLGLVAAGLRARAIVGAELVALAAATSLGIVGIVGVLAGVVGWLVPAVVLPVVVLVSAAFWRSRPRHTVVPTSASRFDRIGLVLIVLVAAGLRWPPMDHSLAGRDQGTYALRAASAVRTGGFDVVDPVVRDALADPSLVGAMDVGGLYAKRGEPWREDVYEAGYRPGWYLADREQGLVVPQFLHLHPAVSAIAMWIAGARAVAAVAVLEGLLCVVALFAIARRLMPHGPWPHLAALLYATSPLCAWVHRNPLSEAPTGLFSLCAVLALLRARDDPGDRKGMLVLAACMLATTAWIRGNAWLTAPVMLAVLWLVPRGPERSPARMVLIVGIAATVVLHGFTVYPYLHDELSRQLTMLGRPSPWTLVIAVTGGVIVWWSVDEIAFGPRSPRGPAIAAAIMRAAPQALLGLAAVALMLWQWRASASDGGAPWSRLDALVPGIGWPLLVVAAAGLVVAVGRWRTAEINEPQVWLVACGAAVVTTLVLYAGRNLPRFGLYYYGRYLVPEVVPVVCAAAAFAVGHLHAVLFERRPRGAQVVAILSSLGLVAATVAPLVLAPSTRLQELEGTDRLIDAIAQRLPPDAIVIAGGEGWHHSHTFNQVAGALAMRDGTQVLPYHSREAAYASLHFLLIAQPTSRGLAPPRVFVLINEASHVLARDVRGAPMALLDDGVSPPFRAVSIATFELVSDRLTPTVDRLPTAVTRDWLRMALVEIVAMPDEVPTVALGGDAPRVPAGVTIEGASGGCVSHDAPLVVRLDGTLDVAGVVVVASPDDAARAESWQITIDGIDRPTRAAGTSARVRQTLGPFAAASPRTITIHGAPKPEGDRECPHGAVTEIRLLGPEQSALARVEPESIVIAPDDDLGHAVVLARWVGGRGLSRLRPQIAPGATMRANALTLTAATPVTFADEPLAAGSYDVVINTTATAVDPTARLRVLADDRLIGEIDPPDTRDRSWQSPPLRYDTTTSVTRWRVELVAGDADTIGLRDVGLFMRPAARE